MPELEVFDGVPADVLELLFAHLPDRLGGHAHDQPAGGHDLALRDHGARADLRAFFDDGAGQHHGADADADVVHDGAGVDHAAVADGDVGAHDAGELRGDVEHGVVLDVGVAPERDVVVLVAAEHGQRPDAGALLDGDVADDLGGGIDPGARVDARGAAGDAADHAGAYFPVQRGFRFSRKALMPSRKSALV